jgi:hypothetical protein
MTRFELVYTLPYHGTLQVQPKLSMIPEKFFVVAANGIKFSPSQGSGFQPEQWPIEPTLQAQSFATTNVRQATFELSGVGQFPQDDDTQQQGANANGRAEGGRPGGGLGVPNERPNPLSSGQWVFLGVITLFLTGGAVFLFVTRGDNTGKGKGPGALLEALKDEMFQLESDRAQGRVSQQEYQTTKLALDKTLQRAMKKANKSAVAG